MHLFIFFFFFFFPSHFSLSLCFHSCSCWVKATTAAGRPRIAEGGEGQQDLHVGCWETRSAATGPPACGMEAASSCMPVVRVRPTHPQLFLSSYSFLFHLRPLFLCLFFCLLGTQNIYTSIREVVRQRHRFGENRFIKFNLNEIIFYLFLFSNSFQTVHDYFNVFISFTQLIIFCSS